MEGTVPELSFLQIAEGWIRGPFQLYDCEIRFGDSRKKRQGSCCSQVCPRAPASLCPQPPEGRAKLLQELQSHLRMRTISSAELPHYTDINDTATQSGKRDASCCPKYSQYFGTPSQVKSNSLLLFFSGKGLGVFVSWPLTSLPENTAFVITKKTANE